MASGNLQVVVQHLHRLAGNSDETEASDAQLLKRFCQTQEEAPFAALVQRHGPMVLGVCQRVLHNSHDAEDAFQATFLILAQKAGSLANPQAVGCWLYEVASRTAVRARNSAAKRRMHEGRVTPMAQEDWLETVAWRDLQPVLDEEVSRLPKQYRIPFVLCYIEGKTYEQAAEQISCLTGTISRRLAKARELLRSRLIRRGITLPAGLLASMLSNCLAPNPVSASLVSTAVKSACNGATSAAALSECVSALVEEGVRAMSASKLKHVLGIVLLVGFFGTAFLLTHRVLANNGAATPPVPTDRSQQQSETVQLPKVNQAAIATTVKATNSQKKSTAKSAKTTLVVGNVLNANGKPAGGAWVAVVGQAKPASSVHSRNVGFVVVGQSKADAKGAFSFRVSGLSKVKFWNASVLAWSPGHVPVSKGFNPDLEKANATIWLAKDKPMRGRLVDLQGQPAAGVPVHLVEMNGAVGILRAGVNLRFHKPIKHLKAWPPPAVTDKDGRFTLQGVGDGWVVKIEIGNDRIAPQRMIINPPADIGQRYVDPRTTGKPDWSNKQQQFTWAVLPARSLVGTVTEALTGKPIPHAKIVAFVGLQRHTLIREHKSETRADAQGKYRLNPRYGDKFNVIAYPPEGQPFLLRSKRFTWANKAAVQQNVDIALRPAVMVHGTVTEADTGKPVAGAAIEYFPHKTANPFYKREFVPTLGYLKQLGITDARGKYQVPVLPGKGYLLVSSITQDYVRKKISPLELATGALERQWLRPQGLLPLDLAEKAKTHTANVQLQRGARIEGRVVDPDGKPLRSGFVVHRSYIEIGYSLTNPRSQPLIGGKFTVSGIDPKKGETVYFFDSSRRFGAAVKFSGKDVGKPITVKLQKCGSIKVRLVDDKGKVVKDWQPRPELVITPGASRWRFDPKNVSADTMPLEFVYRPVLRPLASAGADGYYTVDGIIPGAKFNLYATDARRSLRDIEDSAAKNLTVQPGQTLNIGDARVKARR